jgi:hypothetical protein
MTMVSIQKITGKCTQLFQTQILMRDLLCIFKWVHLLHIRLLGSISGSNFLDNVGHLAQLMTTVGTDPLKSLLSSSSDIENTHLTFFTTKTPISLFWYTTKQQVISTTTGTTALARKDSHKFDNIGIATSQTFLDQMTFKLRTKLDDLQANNGYNKASVK